MDLSGTERRNASFTPSPGPRFSRDHSASMSTGVVTTRRELKLKTRTPVDDVLLQILGDRRSLTSDSRLTRFSLWRLLALGYRTFPVR